MLSFESVAPQRAENEEREGIVGLIRETVDGLRDLIADHIKLARIELVGDAKTYGRSVAVLAVAGSGAGDRLHLRPGRRGVGAGPDLGGARWRSCVVGALHLVVGGIAVAWSVAKMRRTHPMHDTVVEAKDSLNALARPLQGRAS